MTTEKSVSRLIAGAYHSTYHQLVRFFHKRLGNSQDARDLSQDVFARWLKGGGNTSVQETRAFLFKIANNVLVDHWRHSQRKGRDQVSEWDDSHTVDIAQDNADPQVQLEHQQRLTRLYQVLNELPPRQREAFVLYRFDGLSQSDIAEQMDISVSMVEKHIARALLQCKRAMNAGEQKDG